MVAASPNAAGEDAEKTLPRHNRLARRGDFAAAYERGRSHAGQFMVLYVRPRETGPCRMGVVASKRAFHLAVDRNRAKRCMREVFRKHRTELLTGFDLVMVGRTRILEARAPAIAVEFEKLARRAGLWPEAKPS